MTLLVLAADASDSALTTALVALAGVIVTAIGAVVVAVRRERIAAKAKRTSDAQTRELGLIHETQDSLVALIVTQRDEIRDLRQQVAVIPELRDQIAAMRIELADALRNHAECEKARGEQDRIIARLKGDTT